MSSCNSSNSVTGSAFRCSVSNNSEYVVISIRSRELNCIGEHCNYPITRRRIFFAVILLNDYCLQSFLCSHPLPPSPPPHDYKATTVLPPVNIENPGRIASERKKLGGEKYQTNMYNK